MAQQRRHYLSIMTLSAQRHLIYVKLSEDYLRRYDGGEDTTTLMSNLLFDQHDPNKFFPASKWGMGKEQNKAKLKFA